MGLHMVGQPIVGLLPVKLLPCGGPPAQAAKPGMPQPIVVEEEVQVQPQVLQQKTQVLQQKTHDCF